VQRLIGRGLGVRVLTRDPTRARHLRHLDLEIVTADARDRTGIRAALEGATTVVSTVQRI
jgi:uncharacterized protein YbjT (DUF2867 family)